MSDRPSMNALWEQAWQEHGVDEDARRERYAALLSEHGYTRLLADGDPSADLPCGFRGTPKDKRLKANKSGSGTRTPQELRMSRLPCDTTARPKHRGAASDGQDRMMTEGDAMGKPSKGTPKDKRLKANKSGSGSSGGKQPFGGKKAAPFAKGGGRKRG